MCGIMGYTGTGDAVRIAVDGLKQLEYRGYDSAGVAFSVSDSVRTIKNTGRVANLEKLLETDCKSGSNIASAAISHTRWATHGEPTVNNAHPHRDCTGRLAVVHNGIIENYSELRSALEARGHEFVSHTDTEVIAHLLEDQVANIDVLSEHQLLAAFQTVLIMLEGSYALAAVCGDLPDLILAARNQSPLIVGVAPKELFVASDICAILPHTRTTVCLEDGQTALMNTHGLRVFDRNGEEARIILTFSELSPQSTDKGAFSHYMLKEIFESPQAAARALSASRASTLSQETLANINYVCFVACGTALNAGLTGVHLFRSRLKLHSEAVPASEFRSSSLLIDQNSLVICISQSGETADTIAACREARARGAKTLAIVNVPGSTLAREADYVQMTYAGPEIGVASTKAYIAQLMALLLLTVTFVRSQAFEARPHDVQHLEQEIQRLPEQLIDCLNMCAGIRALAEEITQSKAFIFLGRAASWHTAEEAALKLKEITYRHAEAFAAGEMKHGPLALIEPGVTVVGICHDPGAVPKMVNSLQEAKARGGRVIAVLPVGTERPTCIDHVIYVPKASVEVMPALSIVPLQLLAYYVALNLGTDIDKPRNLAKSVTVE
jgi:glutamine---fructose-6-phosphate transaminase (isomerizing)